MLELGQEWRDEEARFTALLGLWVDHQIAARYQEAAELARQMLDVAERIKNPAALADALSSQGCTLCYTGHYSDSLTALNRAIALCPSGSGRSSLSGTDPLVESLAFASQSA